MKKLHCHVNIDGTFTLVASRGELNVELDNYNQLELIQAIAALTEALAEANEV